MPGPSRRVACAYAGSAAEGQCVKVRLTPSTDYGHGRFDRIAVITHGGRRVSSQQMASRWARAVRMNLYAAGHGTLIIRECEYGVLTYRVDLPQGTVAVVDSPSAGHPQEFLGAFDADETSKWRFISASERAELPLPEPER